MLRERRRAGRLGTDGLLILGFWECFGASFWDPIDNWLVPAWSYSTNLVALNDWFAHAPGIVNPDAGTMQWSVVMVLVGYPLWGSASVPSWIFRCAAPRSGGRASPAGQSPVSDFWWPWPPQAVRRPLRQPDPAPNRSLRRE